MMDIEKATDLELDELASKYEQIRAACLNRKSQASRGALRGVSARADATVKELWIGLLDK